MRVDQLIADHRMRLMGVVQSAPSIREGCRRAGIHHSTYYTWLKAVERDGLDGLTARQSRTRIKTPTRIRLEADVVAFSLANPPWGPARLHGELHRRGIDAGSPTKVWRILKDHGLNRARYRYRLLAATKGLAAADEYFANPDASHPHPLTTAPRSRPKIGRLHAEHPGDLVQIDCFHIGRLKEARLGPAKTPAAVWQYTAIDVASSFVWSELHTTARNPSGVYTSLLAQRVAHDLNKWGHHFQAVTTDRGNEFVDHRFKDSLPPHVEHRFIAPGRPQSNGKVEQVHNTILRECWHPAFVTYKEPSITGLRQDLDEYLHYYNHHRPHHGRWNQGQPPATIIIPNTGNHP